MTAPVQIPLTQGKVALVDPEDVALVAAHKWFAKRDSNSAHLYYVRTNVADPTRPNKQRGLSMHRLIMGVLDCPEVQVDHLDGDPLNNRKVNLRLCTQAENKRNIRRHRGPSGFIGVWALPSGRWQATVRIDRRAIYVGSFDTAEEAARARDQKAIELHGEFAVLNFSK